MALDADGFRLRFPEFDRTPTELVDAKLAEAELEIDRTVWGTKADLGVGYLAAHLLSIAPTGQHARLVPRNAKATREDALTTYERQYKRLLKMVSSGFRIVGERAGATND